MRGSPTKQQLQSASKASFFVAAVWVFAGVMYGLLEDKPLVFLFGLVMAAFQVWLGLYARRRATGLTSTVPAERGDAEGG
jgi:hypothetical protein